jgi:hypothetical protein
MSEGNTRVKVLLMSVLFNIIRRQIILYYVMKKKVITHVKSLGNVWISIRKNPGSLAKKNTIARVAATNRDSGQEQDAYALHSTKAR